MAAIPFLGDIDLGNRQVQNHVLHLVGADGTGAEGLLKYRTDLHRGRLYDGTSWRSIAFLDEITGALTFNDTSEIDLTNASGTITAALINGSVANARLANMANGTVKMRHTAGSGAPEDVSLTTLKSDLAIGTGDVSGLSAFVTAFRLDQFAVPTAAVAMNGQKITGLADGTASTDAITLQQLQAAIEGRQWKDPVATTSTGVLPNTPTYSAGAGTLTAGTNAAIGALNGHTPTLGERVLVQGQASSFQDGIYVVTAVGSGAAPWVLTRVADASTAAELSNASVMVEANDSTLRGKVYTQQNTLADLTAATQNWTVTGDNQNYTAGTGLTLSGNVFSITAGGVSGTELNASVAGNGLAGGGGSALSVNTDGTTLEINSDALRIAATAAGAGLVGGGGSALAVGAGTGILSNANDVAVDTAVVVRKYAADVGDGTTTAISVAHGLGTKDVEVFVYRNSDGKEVKVPYTVATSTPFAVTLNFDTAPTSAQYRAVVQA